MFSIGAPSTPCPDILGRACGMAKLYINSSLISGVSNPNSVGNTYLVSSNPVGRALREISSPTPQLFSETQDYPAAYSSLETGS
jgi:hypothetical protein